jgi:hypothetical protein
MAFLRFHDKDAGHVNDAVEQRQSKGPSSCVTETDGIGVVVGFRDQKVPNQTVKFVYCG